MSDLYDFQTGHRPLLISFPHGGTGLPETVARRLTPAGRALTDTDWYVRTLYQPVLDSGVYFLAARLSRIVIDLNRSPTGGRLYPGKRETGLCPTGTFAGKPVYREGAAPDRAEVAARTDRYWRPYHDKLAETLAEIRDRFGYALLWDAHTIKGEVPALFDGVLPDLNFGTGGGTACDAAIADAVVKRAKEARGYSTVRDGRFKGGFITRHYGEPARDVHALQLELSQKTYLADDRGDGAPTVDPGKRAAIRPLLAALVERYLEAAERRYAS